MSEDFVNALRLLERALAAIRAGDEARTWDRLVLISEIQKYLEDHR